MAGELIDQFSEHEARVERFIDRWRDKPDLVALAKSYLAQLQEIEDAAFEVILERDLAGAVGVQLTTIGKVVQQPRTTADDERYRTAIRARIAINLSDSTPEDVIRVLGLILFDGEAFHIREEPPAQLRITIDDSLTSADHDLVQLLLDEADPAGNRLLVEWNNGLADDSAKFKLADLTTGSVGGGSGLASTTGVVSSGGLASVVGD